MKNHKHNLWSIEILWAIIWVILFSILVLIIWSTFKVDVWERAMISRFWQVGSEIYSEWLHMKAPFIDTPIILDIKTQRVDGKSDAASKDLQSVTAMVSINYDVRQEAIQSIIKNFMSNENLSERIIFPSIQETVKATTSTYTAVELVTKRKVVGEELKKSLSDKLSKYGIDVKEVNIVDFKYSEWFDKAIEEKVKAEQEALIAKNKLAQFEFEAQQKIATAKWERESRILKAQWEAEAIRIQSEAITKQWGKEYVELKRIEKWDWTVPKITSAGGMLMNVWDILK